MTPFHLQGSEGLFLQSKRGRLICPSSVKQKVQTKLTCTSSDPFLAHHSAAQPFGNSEVFVLYAQQDKNEHNVEAAYAFYRGEDWPFFPDFYYAMIV